jgi:Flp pilus assembly CpaE family ATPase
MSRTERSTYEAALESKEAELAGRLGNRDGIAIEKTADPLDEVQSAGERELAIRNLHRLDSSLLESFMTRHSGGLQLLAGANMPLVVEPATAEFARLFDLLVGHFRYVVVDASSRVDATTRLVCNLSETVLLVAHADVASLWSANRIQQYLGETGGRERVRLVLNRFRKIAGFSESDAEAAAGAKLLWKIPNQYFAVSGAIDRGVPVMQQAFSEMGRSFAGLAAVLTENDIDVKRKAWSLFKTV